MKWLNKIFDRIELGSIYKLHLNTLSHYEKKQFYNKVEVPTSDKFIFIGIPIFISLLLIISGLQFNNNYVNIGLTCLSIFTGLLFTLLAIVLGVINENNKINIDELLPHKRKKYKATFELTNHLFINIAFSLVVSVLAIFIVLLTQVYPKNIIILLKKYFDYYLFRDIYLYTINFIAFFLIIEFLLLLMMIIKRFTLIFLNQIE
ncbi:hypothetical protein [Chryseobacterium sp. Hurlbut01]|uniref:hypothetical protein n=1 Tax=Chryseobacterium sp. Hurlbut01 TaxID=1681828 RepID=UPI00067D4646|nr:hypothetical protein [Chryseobacterium sp. Hurlbut01]KNB60719.1 hypothetical protein AC804_16265 [Chryseobacterium sp. Hurlbut01]